MARSRVKPGATSRRFPRDVIVKCIQRVHDGASMYSVGKEIGARTNTVKYWVDHAHRYLNLPEKLLKADGDLDEYHRQRFQNNGWAAICHMLQASKKVSDPAFLTAIANYIDKVVPLLLKTTKTPDRDNGKKPKAGTVDEPAWQEVELAVARLKRVKSGDEVQESQRTDPAEGEQGKPAGGEVIDVPTEKHEGKGANEASSDRT